jgi:hypothetical protein
MGFSLSLNKQCARCPRVEQKPITLDEAVAQAKSGKKPASALEIRLDGETLVEFEDLCEVCRSIVVRYVENVGKRPKHQSALREQTEIQVEQD